MTDHNKECNSKKLGVSKSKIVIGTVILAVAMALITLGINLKRDKTSDKEELLAYLSSLSNEEQVFVGQLIGDTYRNLYGYYNVCKDNGVLIDNYSKEFSKILSEELSMLNQLLAKDKLDLNSAFLVFVPNENREEIHKSLYNDLRQLAASDDTGITSSCNLINNEAVKIIQTMAEKSKPFYRNILEPLLND